ncbi:hypothetical protein GCK72_016853 [Caenorhabditis remanei]|uniref:Uncharacterized protein n=1 Tax=Caenorhabditis remanei TaxID=31234 RepID=A0A6A5G6L9_CAERE|nr:hypothetical protein GCK72_016853 [Caenorhabditis remanei]KAF1750305.1 hypothetical protein GCK72_016853 [Caenorhabditis remanei]
MATYTAFRATPAPSRRRLPEFPDSVVAGRTSIVEVMMVLVTAAGRVVAIFRSAGGGVGAGAGALGVKVDEEARIEATVDEMEIDIFWKSDIVFNSVSTEYGLGRYAAKRKLATLEITDPQCP